MGRADNGCRGMRSTAGKVRTVRVRARGREGKLQLRMCGRVEKRESGARSRASTKRVKVRGYCRVVMERIVGSLAYPHGRASGRSGARIKDASVYANAR
jgi:hypothetical protein